MTKTSTIVCEIDSPANANIMFRPWNKLVRGRFDLHRVKDASAGALMNQFPLGIPGQFVSLDLVAETGAIIEPLYEAKFAAIRERIESMGQKLAPEREDFPVDIMTSLWWLKQLVDANKAKIVSGEFPSIDESRVKRRFHTTERLDSADKLVAAIERQAELQAEQNTLLTQLLSKLVDK